MTSRMFACAENTSDQDYRAMLSLRLYWSKRHRITLQARSPGAKVSVPRSADWPDKGYSVWARWLYEFGPQVNPMWAILFECDRQFMDNKAGNLAVLLQKKRLGEYIAYGLGACNNQLLAAQSTVYQLTERLASVRMSMGFADMPSTLLYIASQAQLDPVLTLLTWERYQLPLTDQLLKAARLHYAFCPEIYEAVPPTVRSRLNLKSLFKEQDHDGVRTGRCVGVDGLCLAE